MAMRTTAIVAIVLAAACSDNSGPDLDANPFIHVTVNGAAWPDKDSDVSLFDGRLRFIAYGDLPDPVDRFELDAGIGPFNGTGNYPLQGLSAGSVASMAIRDTLGNPPTSGPFLADAAHPGTWQVTGFRSSDSTTAANFQVVMIDENDPSDTLHVSVSFLIRPNNNPP